MGQVFEEKSLGPPSGRPGCNLDHYIKERDPYKKGDQGLKRREERERESENIIVQELVLTFT